MIRAPGLASRLLTLAMLAIPVVARAPELALPEGADGRPLTPAVPLTLWVWERPEDLHFLRGQPIDIAALLATVVLRDDEVEVRRRQGMRVAERARVIR